jgi:hypothetical protein
VCGSFWGVEKFKPADVAMVTKVQKILNSLQPIPIFLAYLVPLDVDIVPIKFHQFLFGE